MSAPRAIFYAAFLFAPALARAQDDAPPPRRAPDREAFESARVEHLREAFDLTDAQVALFERAAEEHGPGALWTLAAELTPTLTPEQRERLFAPGADIERMPRRRMRADSLDRPERPRRTDRTDRPDRVGRSDRAGHAADGMHGRDAMIQALALSSEQVEAFEALVRERHASDEVAPARSGGGVPPEVAEILTPQQEEVWQVHHALARQLRHRSPGPRP